jgi:hypothetical protein
MRTPVFTKKIAHGLGVAEDPGNGEGFGQHRCRVLAEGMICAYEQGAATLEQRMQVVSEAFRKAEVDLNCPYLNAQSADHYTFTYT